ncbi:MAG: hypothetical protein LIP05_16010, partial [Tannerellaceae bacterium]|nr:hypothetical protein [Tannerellaceae bacterium]
ELTLFEGESVELLQMCSVLPGYDYLAVLKLHDDKNFKDRFVGDTLTLSKIAKENSNLKDSPHKFNDKCSLLIITNNLPNPLQKQLN